MFKRFNTILQGSKTTGSCMKNELETKGVPSQYIFGENDEVVTWADVKFVSYFIEHELGIFGIRYF